MSSQLRLTLYAALATMATATALLSEFDGKGWVIPVMGGILLVSASCGAVRASSLPSALEPLTAALAVLLWITGLEAHAHAHLGFIPGRTAFRHLGKLARHGFDDLHHQPTPAPTHHGLVMLTVIGVSALALVVDLLVVTLRRAALSGLPLLGLFTICAATGHHGVSVGPFVLASAGYLLLLYADNREKVARWGAAVGTGHKARPASAWSTDPSSAPPPASLGRRVGAAAISVGVVVPFLIPGLHTGIDRHSSGGGSGTGTGAVQVQDPIVNVAADLNTTATTKLFTYTTTAKDPTYLRMTALDQFNGSAFSGSTLTETDKDVPSEDLGVTAPRGTQVTTTISFLPGSSAYELSYLPVPSVVLGTSVGEPWRYDAPTATIYSATTTTTPSMSYTTRSITNNPTPEDLNSVGRAASDLGYDMIVPKTVSKRVYALEKQITAGATTDYQAALAIQHYFTDGNRFTYSTDIPPDHSKDPLYDFLFTTKTGFCQQFATAMTALARIASIPARVAVGFTPGTKHGDTYTVTTHDAHAWPELWFQGYGWLAFEPTPRSDGQAQAPPYAAVKPSTVKNNGGKNHHNPSPTSSPRVFQGQHDPRVGAGSTDPTGGKKGHRAHAATGGLGAGLIAVLIVAILALLCAPGVGRSMTRRRRLRVIRRDPTLAASAAWAEIRDTTVDLGGAWDDGRSPRQLAAGLLTVVGPATDARASIRRLAECEERARYAATAPPVAADLRQDVALLREAIAASRNSRQRARAIVVPRSTLLALRARLAVIDRLLGRVERAGGRARHRLRIRPKAQPTS